jgi:hypothetical protein
VVAAQAPWWRRPRVCSPARRMLWTATSLTDQRGRAIRSHSSSGREDRRSGYGRRDGNGRRGGSQPAAHERTGQRRGAVDPSRDVPGRRK